MGAVVGETKTERLVIPPPKFMYAEIEIVGTAPYVQNKFSGKARAEIVRSQEAGSQGKSKKKFEPKDFNALYEAAIHRSAEGWIGIPAPAFRAAMVSACRLVGFKMTLAKLSVFVIPDGFDPEDGTPLVRIIGEPERHDAYVRNKTGVDIRARPMWREWSSVLNVRFDGDQFSIADITNLVARVGMQVGIGEGRPDSKTSTGMGWGTFDVKREG